MGDETKEAGTRICNHTTRTILSIATMLMLIWVVLNGYTLATKRRDSKTGVFEDSYAALVFGVVTVVFGLIYFIIGLTIVAELAMDLLAWMQQEDHGTSKNEEKEETTICQVFVHTLALMASMLMLTWAIYYGYKLAAEAPKVVIYDRLAFVIGVISMAFGFVYFIIGLATVADSALHLLERLQHKVSKSNALLDRLTEVSLEV